MAIPLLLSKLYIGLTNIIADAFNIDLEGTADWWKNLGRDFIDFFDFRSGGRIPSGRSGLRMTKGTGLAMLHPNEFVVPQSGMMPQAVNRTLDSMSNQTGTQININSMITERSAVDELVRRIENRYQLFGQSRSTLFAG
jgi:hypothetical protein